MGSDMNLWHLKIFQMVAKHTSYTKAADALRISQSAVSHEVRAFEKWLGVTLFDHVGKHIHLTEAGMLLDDYARRIFALVEDAEQALEEFKGLRTGRLRIGASTTPGIYWLPKTLGAFRQKHPGITLSLAIENTAAIERMALRNEIDVGITGKRSTEKGLHLEPINRDRLTLIVPPDHPLARKRQVALRELAGERILLRESGSATRALIEQGLKKAGIHVNVVMELGSTEAIKRAVASHLGVAIISQHACDNDGPLYRRVGLVEPALEREFFLIYHKQKHLSAAAKAFIALL